MTDRKRKRRKLWTKAKRKKALQEAEVLFIHKSLYLVADEYAFEEDADDMTEYYGWHLQNRTQVIRCAADGDTLTIHTLFSVPLRLVERKLEALGYGYIEVPTSLYSWVLKVSLKRSLS